MQPLLIILYVVDMFACCRLATQARCRAQGPPRRQHLRAGKAHAARGKEYAWSGVAAPGGGAGVGLQGRLRPQGPGSGSEAAEQAGGGGGDCGAVPAQGECVGEWVGARRARLIERRSQC